MADHNNIKLSCYSHINHTTTLSIIMGSRAEILFINQTGSLRPRNQQIARRRVSPFDAFNNAVRKAPSTSKSSRAVEMSKVGNSLHSGLSSVDN